jgi:hypothetical protein
MLSRQKKNVRKLYEMPVVSIQTFKQLKVAIYLNEANLQAMRDRLNKNLLELNAAKVNIKSLMTAIKEDAGAIVIQMRRTNE